MLEKLGAQMYTVRAKAQTPEEIRAAFFKIRDMGYKSVQVSGLGPISPEELHDISAQSNLPIVVTHNTWNRIANDFDALMEEHRIFGCECIGLGAMPAEFRGSYEGAKDFIKIIDTLSKRAKVNGFKFCYHNHAFEFKKLNGTRTYDMMVQELPDTSFILDTYWVQYAGADVIKYMRDLNGRIDNLHLKDLQIDDENKPYITEVLNGNLNFDGILDTAREIGVSWYLVEQDTCPGDPFDSLKISIDNLMAHYG